jgi:hypothetical protein
MERLDDEQRLPRAAVTAAKGCIQERQYDEAQKILRGPVLHALKDDVCDKAYETRVQAYYLLSACPEVQFEEEEIKGALSDADHIIERRKEYTRKSHLLSQVVHDAFSSIEEGDPRQEWKEAYALTAAEEEIVLGKDKESRIYALMLIILHGDDNKEKSSAFDELLKIGDEWSITHACMRVRSDFHLQTNTEYLDKILPQLEEPAYKARLQYKKLRIMSEEFDNCTNETPPERVYEIARKIREAYMNFLLVVPSSALSLRIQAEYNLGAMALKMRDINMGLFHLRCARDMANFIGYTIVADTSNTLIKQVEEEHGLE